MGSRSQDARLGRLKAMAKRRAKKGRGFVILPHRALAIHETSPVRYAREYFRSLTVAPFFGPLAQDFDFETESSFDVRIATHSGIDLVDTINDTLYDLHQYLSNYLTHPRYGPEKQLGFSRGDTLRPVALREVAPGLYRFRIRGIVVGDRTLLRELRGPNLDGPPAPTMGPPAEGWQRIFLCMPTRPDSPQVGDTEWYDFSPRTWKRHHPNIPLRPPVAVLLRPRAERAVVAPKYEQLARDGVIRVSFLFGYDDEGHETTQDAATVWKILTAPTDLLFTKHEMGDFGYLGPGLGFEDPTDGDFKKLNLNGTTVFRRGFDIGAGPVDVTHRLERRPLYVGGRDAPEGTVLVGGQPVKAGRTVPLGTVVTRKLAAEVRLFNFDKSSTLTTDELLAQFVSVFKDSDIVLYDGHANYGGGFFVGEQANDILWAWNIGDYSDSFSPEYQIFAIGACHAAGYFADLFYNELSPKKGPHNLDIIAAVNEADFTDAVHQMMALFRGVVHGARSGDAPHYERILSRMIRPAHFQANIGAFGEAPRARPLSRQPVRSARSRRRQSGPKRMPS